MWAQLMTKLFAVLKLEPQAAIIGNLQSYHDGVQRWYSHPYERKAPDYVTVWQSGSTKVHLRPDTSPDQNRLPVLIVPSLINKNHILDLTPEDSFMNRLETQHIQPYLLDWGIPNSTEISFQIEDYILSRLIPAIEHIAHLTGKKVVLLGHCIGGILCTAAAQLCDKVAALTTIGTPWDFTHLPNLSAEHQAIIGSPNFSATVAGMLAQIPAEQPQDNATVFNALFSMLTPDKQVDKFAKFASLDQQNTAQFVAVEDWLVTQHPVTKAVTSQILLGWHLGNQIMNGDWNVGGKPIIAAKIDLPAFCICGENDSITAHGSALALANQIAGSVTLSPDSGHIGMIIGRESDRSVIPQLQDFLNSMAQ